MHISQKVFTKLCILPLTSDEFGNWNGIRYDLLVGKIVISVARTWSILWMLLALDESDVWFSGRYLGHSSELMLFSDYFLGQLLQWTGRWRAVESAVRRTAVHFRACASLIVHLGACCTKATKYLPGIIQLENWPKFLIHWLLDTGNCFAEWLD